MDVEAYEKILAEDIISDYEARQAERRPYEAQWQLNAHFVAGNQYVGVSPSGAIVGELKSYKWEERAVYNHVAPILETRLAKLSRVRPKMSVRPASSDENDVTAAKVSAKILDSSCSKNQLDTVIGEATMWSELTGTAFYKISWDGKAGMTVGKSDSGVIKEGDVRIDVCSPYEIYPDSVGASSVSDCNSIIHAKAVHVNDVKRIWGADVESEGVTAYSYGGPSGIQVVNKPDHVLVIERYTRPSSEFPRGKYEAVAGNKLVYDGELPFKTGEDGNYDLPFVRQRSMALAGCFFGTCPIERAIPVQRAYNAVKNRKHEFMNRIASGVLVVEDGSVDVEELEEDGIYPGKVLVYRAGSTPPEFLNPGTIPDDFDKEESKLIEEFGLVSGVSDLMSSSSVPSRVTSGSALELLIEQDDERLTVAADEIRFAIKNIGKQMLRLYRQFANESRLSRFVGESGEIEIITWKGSNLASDDIVIDAQTELSDSAASRRNTILELYSAGLLNNADGTTDENMRYKILNAFGFASLEHVNNVAELQRRRAKQENAFVSDCVPKVKIYDDHRLHIDEHTSYLLSQIVDAESERKLGEHISEHKKAIMNEKED